jgi:hypothetical protein
MTDPLNETLVALERAYAELQANLPAHSLPPSLLARMEDLEAEIADLRARIDARRAHDYSESDEDSSEGG